MSDICVVIVAGLILWISSSIVSYETRITVLENNVEYIRGDISEIKMLLKEIQSELKK